MTSAPARRSGRYPATPWAEERLYRPFVRASIAVALTLGVAAGATMLVWSALGHSGLAWITHLQPHGVAQLFGWAGLFIMGIGQHVIPRFRGNARIDYPWPQRAMLTLVVAGIVLRAGGQALHAAPALAGPLLAASGVALLAGVAIFAVTLGLVLRRGSPAGVPVERWVAAGLAWGVVAAALHLVVTWRMAAEHAVGAPADLNQALISAAAFGFVGSFLFGVSLRASSNFMGLRPAHARLEVVAFALTQGGVLWLTLGWLMGGSPGATAGGTLTFALGALLFTAALRVLEPPRVRREPGPVSYARFHWFLVTAYAWLTAAAVLYALSAIDQIAGWPAIGLRAAPALHTFSMGFVTMTILGFASRVLPLFEGTALRRPRLMDAAFVLLNASVALRVAFGVLDLPAASAGLALSGVLGLGAVTCFAAVIWPLLSARREFVHDTARSLPVVSAR